MHERVNSAKSTGIAYRKGNGGTVPVITATGRIHGVIVAAATVAATVASVATIAGTKLDFPANFLFKLQMD